jgi:hypothetical protein
LLEDIADSGGLDIEFYNQITERQNHLNKSLKKSLTKMLTGCCKLRVRTAASKKRKLKARMKFVNQVHTVITKHPTLGANGFCTKRTKTDIDKLIGNIGEIEFVISLLADIRKTRRINRWCEPSLVLKDLIEPYSPNKSISHGAFIIGAIIAGFQVKVFKGGPSAQFDFSPKALRGKMTTMRENWLLGKG